MNKAFMNRKNASTVIPTNLKGMSKSQIKGYRSKARIANGQQRRSKINQSINFINISLQR
jgi:hypothetical protein